MCAGAQKRREGMLIRVSNVCVRGREESPALSDVWWLLKKLGGGTSSKAPAAPEGSGSQRLQCSHCSTRDEKLNCGTIEWFGLEETFQGDLIQPCNDQGQLQADQAAQSPIQPDLECSRDGASTSLWEAYPSVSPPLYNFFFPISSLNLLV